jgi:hypothetical protein
MAVGPPARADHCLDGFSVTLCHDPTIRGTRPLWPGPRWRKEGQGERPDADVTRLDLEGSVHHHPPEDKAQEWRAAIRKVAREMGWRIQTGYRSDVGLVWAYRRDFEFRTRRSMTKQRHVTLMRGGLGQGTNKGLWTDKCCYSSQIHPNKEVEVPGNRWQPKVSDTKANLDKQKEGPGHQTGTFHLLIRRFRVRFPGDPPLCLEVR